MSGKPFLAIDLKKILDGAQLPALPQSAIRLLELSQDSANGPAEFAVPIESDPGLAGQVLRFVNSSYFGFAKEISSVKLAITLVGVRTIKNFALWSAVFSLMPNPKCGPFDLRSLWQDSLRRALFARAAARILGAKEVEEAFSAALLQDMAVPLLAKELPDVYVKLLAARDQGRLRLSTLEHHAFGVVLNPEADIGGHHIQVRHGSQVVAEVDIVVPDIDAVMDGAPGADQLGRIALFSRLERVRPRSHRVVAQPDRHILARARGLGHLDGFQVSQGVDDDVGILRLDGLRHLVDEEELVGHVGAFFVAQPLAARAETAHLAIVL